MQDCYRGKKKSEMEYIVNKSVILSSMEFNI